MLASSLSLHAYVSQSLAMMPSRLRDAARRCRRVGILDLDPVRRTARPIGRIAALADDAFQPDTASVAEHPCAVVVEMPAQPDPGRRAMKELDERITARMPGLPPHVVAVELDQVEGVEKHGGSSAVAARQSGTQRVEIGHSIVARYHRL